jgi:PAS domain S-box-containing protein
MPHQLLAEHPHRGPVQESYRDAFHHSPVPSWIYCPKDWRLLAVNEAACAHFGYSREEMLTLTIQGLRTPEDWSALIPLLRADTEPRVLRARHRRKDGSVMEAEVFSSRTEFAGVMARIVVAQDLTARLQAKNHLQRLVGAFEATMEGVAVLQGDLYVYMNPAHAVMYGYTVAELLGQPWRMLYDDDEVRRIEAEAFPQLAQRGCWSGSTRGRRKDGSVIYGDISLTNTPTGDLICACRDNSERNRQEEMIRLSQEQLSLVLEATEEGTWDWDVQSGRVVFSDQWLAMLGYSPGELPGELSSWADRLHPDDRARVEADIQAFLHVTGGRFLSEYRMRHKEGGWRWISDRGKVVERDPSGRPIRAVGAHTDITARRAAEFTLEQRTRELLEANAGLARAAQVRDEFLARISHELRTPMTTILALVEMLLYRRAEPLTERQRARILSVQESGQHLVELIDEILFEFK